MSAPFVPLRASARWLLGGTCVVLAVGVWSLLATAHRDSGERRSATSSSQVSPARSGAPTIARTQRPAHPRGAMTRHAPPTFAGHTSEAIAPALSATELQTRWEKEHDDAEWTREQADLIRNLFDDFAIPEERLVNVQCRETVCRAVVEVSELGAFYALSQELDAGGYPAISTLGTEGSDAASRTTVFFARPAWDVPVRDEEAEGASLVLDDMHGNA